MIVALVSVIAFISLTLLSGYVIRELIRRTRKLEDYIMFLGNEKAERVTETNSAPENKELKERAKKISLFDRVFNKGTATSVDLAALGKEETLF